MSGLFRRSAWHDRQLLASMPAAGHDDVYFACSTRRTKLLGQRTSHEAAILDTSVEMQLGHSLRRTPIVGLQQSAIHGLPRLSGLDVGSTVDGHHYPSETVSCESSRALLPERGLLPPEYQC